MCFLALNVSLRQNKRKCRPRRFLKTLIRPQIKEHEFSTISQARVAAKRILAKSLVWKVMFFINGCIACAAFIAYSAHIDINLNCEMCIVRQIKCTHTYTLSKLACISLCAPVEIQIFDIFSNIQFHIYRVFRWQRKYFNSMRRIKYNNKCEEANDFIWYSWHASVLLMHMHKDNRRNAIFVVASLPLMHSFILTQTDLHTELFMESMPSWCMCVCSKTQSYAIPLCFRTRAHLSERTRGLRDIYSERMCYYFWQFFLLSFVLLCLVSRICCTQIVNSQRLSGDGCRCIRHAREHLCITKSLSCISKCLTIFDGRYTIVSTLNCTAHCKSILIMVCVKCAVCAHVSTKWKYQWSLEHKMGNNSGEEGMCHCSLIFLTISLFFIFNHHK